MNALVGEKVSIVTHKVQTTRFQVRGIAMIDNAQLVLVDTPGIFNPKDRLARSMVHAAWSGVDDADAIVHVIDAPAALRVLDGDQTTQDKLAFEDTKRVMAGLKRRERGEVFLALNKIDEKVKVLVRILHPDLRRDFAVRARILPLRTRNSAFLVLHALGRHVLRIFTQHSARELSVLII